MGTHTTCARGKRASYGMLPAMTIPLRPYVLGQSTLNRGLWGGRLPEDALVFDVLDPETGPVGELLSIANQTAFGNLGMPGWVQLDCATLPSFFSGFALPVVALPAEVHDALLATAPARTAAALEATTWVPVSGFCAARTADPACIVAFSLFAVLPRRALGLRTKALGLLLHGARRQIGVTQYANSAVRIHSAFGPLRVLSATAPGHTHPLESFVYEVAVPAGETLETWAQGARPPRIPGDLPANSVPLAGDVSAQVAALLQEAGAAWIVAPGHGRRGPDRYLALSRVASPA